MGLRGAQSPCFSQLWLQNKTFPNFLFVYYLLIYIFIIFNTWKTHVSWTENQRFGPQRALQGL